MESFHLPFKIVKDLLKENLIKNQKLNGLKHMEIKLLKRSILLFF